MGLPGAAHAVLGAGKGGDLPTASALWVWPPGVRDGLGHPLLLSSCSPEGSSVDKPTPQEVATLLQGYARRLRQRQALVKTPPELGPSVEPTPTMPHAEAMVQAMLETQPGPALPRLEKMEIQRELVATRVHRGCGPWGVRTDRGVVGTGRGKGSAGLGGKGFLEEELKLGF